MKKYVLYVDVKNVLSDYNSVKDKVKPNITEMGFFQNMPLVPGAKEGVEKLKKMFDVHAVLSPEWPKTTTWFETRVWIGLHFADKLPLIIINDKSLLKGRFMITSESKSHGADQFEGALITFGPDGAYQTWEEVLKSVNL